MKLNTRNTAKSSKGMTLLELTVVILVLLSLISILFVGARAWKRGSDRAGCILNIRNVQQAVRGHQNMYSLKDGDGLAASKIYTDTAGDANDATGAYLKTPHCPADASVYAPLAVVPALGTLYVTCANATSLGHVPNDTTGW